MKQRIPEGALSADRTPTTPPAKTRLVPLGSDLLRVNQCPCGADFKVETHNTHRVTQYAGASVAQSTETTEWTVTCAVGHVYDVACTTNLSPKWVLIPERREEAPDG